MQTGYQPGLRRFLNSGRLEVLKVAPRGENPLEHVDDAADEERLATRPRYRATNS